MNGTEEKTSGIGELNKRSREVFRRLVDAYVETGEPVGSRMLSRRLSMALSPATVRNVMADLEEMGLLYAPHASAGRLPTDLGLRVFVTGLLEVGGLSSEERGEIESLCRGQGKSLENILSEVGTMLSGLSQGAGLVLSPKTDRALRHIEFVSLAPGRALVVIVNDAGVVENRLIEIPEGLPPSILVQASNYLSSRLAGRTVEECRAAVMDELICKRAELDELTAKVVAAGLATWGGGSQTEGALIVRGQSNLLADVHAIEDLERIRTLFEALETREQMLKLLELVSKGEGVQIFIGSEHKLFERSGCSLIVSPYQNSSEQIVGAIGVIGPTRINYARIIPLVDYTAKVIGRLLG